MQRNMSELTIGQRVTVRPKVGQVVEGVLYTLDALTNTITIKKKIDNTNSTIVVFNRAHVEIDAVPGGKVLDADVALPNIR